MLAFKNKTPFKSRTLSPSQTVLSPNNDDYERAQMRAARAAAQRRKSFVGIDAEKSKPKSFDDEDILGKDQILDLLQNCIKLASENKINQRNTWELRLIDHISEIVNADEGDDTETNFQKASCTLEAGVKIYSYRVDSVHSEAYKVLGGLNRTAATEEGDPENDCTEVNETQEEDSDNKKKESQKKISTSSATLESYEALNVKKFDVAFTVDPLFNQMSAQFDEGGAKGLLLNSLSVYNGCKLVFDSSDIPTKYTKSNNILNGSATINLPSIKDCFQTLKTAIKTETDITPTLREMLTMLDDPYRAAAAQELKQNVESNADDCTDCQSVISEDGGMGEVMDDFVPEEPEESHTTEPGIELQQDNTSWDCDFPAQDFGDNDDTYDQVTSDESTQLIPSNEDDARQLVDWITAAVDLKSNAWAGPDHWKFKKAQDVPKDAEPPLKATDKKRTKHEKFSIDFLCLPKVDMSAFAPASDPKSLLMAHHSSSVTTLLPDDCHYQPEDLVRLFLQPSVMCINQKGKRRPGLARTTSNTNAFDMSGMEWGNSESCVTDDWDHGNIQNDVEFSEDSEMIPEPRKVQKIEVDYDKTSKQIDVRALKETLWHSLQDTSVKIEEEAPVEEEEPYISFKSLLTQVPSTCGVAAPGDISVHLCFICLLHLANEHNLKIIDTASLDELYIQNVGSDSCTSELTSC